jgi:hypothetical protein
LFRIIPQERAAFFKFLPQSSRQMGATKSRARELPMLAATSKFLRQIVPPVIATLIAALLIAGFNRAFSVHLSQPRLGGLNNQASTEAPSERESPRAEATAALRPAPVAEIIAEITPAREWEKGGREAVKDQAAIKITEAAPAQPAPVQPAPVQAASPLATPAQPAPVVRKPEPRQASRQVEPRHVDTRRVEVRPVEPRVIEPHAVAAPVMVPTVPAAPPVVVAAPVIAAPPTGEPLMVTVPDRPRVRALPPEGEPQFEQPAPPQGPIGTIVNTLKPSTWFDRAREFGEKIEAVGNDILPNIRQ